MIDIKQLLQNMTLKEKVGQLNQRLYGWKVFEKKDGDIQLTDYFKNEVSKYGTIGVIYGVFRSDPWSGRDTQSGLSKNEALKVSKLIQSYMKENTRLKIPVLLSEECPHGHQALDSLTTPVNFSVGCSWNPSLYQELQNIVADELQEKGAHLGLISTLDVLRDPRWGRSEECFSEDPFLTAQFTQAAVQGLQENNQIIAVLKHLAGQSDAMGGHNSGPVAIGERELREIYLPAIQAGIKVGAKGCMAAYNDIDGIPCHANQHLLQDILRDEYGFDGIVMADGCALDRVSDICGSRVEAAARALNSGIDVSLWDEVYPNLEEAVLSGLVDENKLDEAVFRILKIKDELNLFNENPEYVTKYDEKIKADLCTNLSEESIVLLKNRNILPLALDGLKKVAVIGPHANNIYHMLGDYTPFKDLQKGTTILQGIKDKLGNTDTLVCYEPGCNIMTEISNGVSKAIKVAENSDVIFVTVGGSSARDFTTEFDKNGAAITGSVEMTSGENIDLADLSLPKCQIELVKKLSETNKKIIAIVVEGRPHSLKEIEAYVDGILLVGYPGEYGGRAIANVLFGKNPNGRLSFSIPDLAGQLPVYYNYRNTMFKEDYADASGKPGYPFGYGLSYTSFEIENVDIQASSNSEIKISCDITNVGQIGGAEVIQIYGKKDQGFIASRERELLAFTKIYLEPGETKNIELSLTKESLSYLDENFKQKVSKRVQLVIKAMDFEKKQNITL